MSDIVERLRIPHSCMWKLNNAASVIEMYEEDRSEAAAEIERLREALRLITYGDGDFKLLQSIARAALPKG
jgi:hypothetical protein